MCTYFVIDTELGAGYQGMVKKKKDSFYSHGTYSLTWEMINKEANIPINIQ